MRRMISVLAVAGLLTACSDQSQTQKDPIDNTPPPQQGQTQQGQNTAPTDRSPAPQGGTGGNSQTTSPTGTTNR